MVDLRSPKEVAVSSVLHFIDWGLSSVSGNVKTLDRKECLLVDFFTAVLSYLNRVTVLYSS